MLEHQKMVLQNVADNKELFQKELEKSLVWLDPIEITRLENWVRIKFGNTHNNIISNTFSHSKTTI